MNKLKLSGWLLLVCMLPLLAKAQFSETRNVVKSFPVTKQTQVEIGNKYGKIDIKTWEKDSVRFEVKISVEEKKLSKLEEVLKEIDFNITTSQNYLIFQTEVDKNKSSLGKEIQKFKETLLSSDGNIQIDYTVWMPNTNQLKIENKFGDIFIGDYLGEIRIDLSNGNLKASDFTKPLDLTLNFADATISSIPHGRLDCNFSKLYVKKLGAVRITSKSTEFDIQESEDLNLNSRRDKFRIRQADLIDATGSFSNFRVSELTDRINIRTEYGDLEIEETAPDFSGIIIQSKNTDVSLNFDREGYFNYDLTYSKTELSLSSMMKEQDKEVSEDEKTVKEKGYFGKKSNDSPKLNITADSGSINIRER